MKKLTVFTLYSQEGASSNFRAFIFKDKFSEDYETRWLNFWPRRYIEKYVFEKKKYAPIIFVMYVFCLIRRIYQALILSRHSNVIFIQKGMFPYLCINFIDYFKTRKIRVVFDVDDAIYLNKRDSSDLIAKKCDAVICGNRTLYKHYSQYNDNCLIIPTTDDTRKYKEYWDDTFDKKVIGWIGSSATIDNLDMIKTPLNRLFASHSDLIFVYVSNEEIDFEMNSDRVRFVKWRKDNYLEVLSSFTVGIMPLFNSEINRGKCGFKLIQYLSMRKPVVGSSVGVNEEIISNYGECAVTEDDWYNNLEKMMYSRENYNRYVQNIDNYFLKEYGYDCVAARILKVLEGEKNDL